MLYAFVKINCKYIFVMPALISISLENKEILTSIYFEFNKIYYLCKKKELRTKKKFLIYCETNKKTNCLFLMLRVKSQ